MRLWSIAHVKRDVNCVDHFLAHEAIFSVINRVWAEVKKFQTVFMVL
jgi:hypothetical protein